MSKTPPRRGEPNRAPGEARRATPPPATKAKRTSPTRSTRMDDQDEQQDWYDPDERPYRNTRARTASRTEPRGRRPPPPRYSAPRRDPFPVIMGAVVGALIVGLLFVLFLLLTRNNGPTLQSANTDNSASAQATQAVISIQTVPAGSDTDSQPTSAAMDRTADPNSTPPGLQTMQAIRPATGLGTPVADEGNAHVADGESISYKVYPPVSGTHYDVPTSAGFYDKTIAEGNFVHSLEHVYIVIYYKPDVPDATKQQLKDLMTQLPNGKYGSVKLVIVPYTRMTTPLAIAAWDRLLLLNQFSADEIRTFYQEWVDKGPEDVP
jgi:hypothetical protein